MVGIDLKRKRKSVEHKEQVRVVQHVRAFYPDVVIAAIPNGGDRTASERLRMHGEGVLAGMPDLCVLRACGGFHGLFVEMKTDVGRQSQGQIDLEVKLRAEGYRCEVARSATEAIKIIEEYLG
jgi:ribosomal protein L31E